MLIFVIIINYIFGFSPTGRNRLRTNVLDLVLEISHSNENYTVFNRLNCFLNFNLYRRNECYQLFFGVNGWRFIKSMPSSVFKSLKSKGVEGAVRR